jgi:hypothetical protein
MNTTKLALGLAAVALLASAAAPAKVDINGVNPLHPAYYVNKLGMNFVEGAALPAGADLSRTNPLHPAYHAMMLDDGRWVGTKARSSALTVETALSPLHPHFYWR